MRMQLRSAFVILLLGCLFTGALYAQPMEVVFEDDFSDNRHEWSESEVEKNSLRIENGQYWFHHKVEEGAWLTWKDVEIDPQKDFVIRTTITKVSGVDNYGYGLLWGLQDVDHYYQFALSGNGHFRYVKSDGEDWTDLIAWTKSDLIRQNDGATNTIAVHKEGQQLKFWVNDQLIAEAEFEPFFGNQIGYIVYNIMEISIDELRVEQPAPEEQLVQTVQPTPTPLPAEILKPLPEIKPETVSANRVALVIGNNAYGRVPLATPLHDAQAITRGLEALGFYVMHAHNLALPEMETAINSFLGLLPGREMAIFYFSGHAAQRRGENYLLPVGENIRSEDHLLYEALNVGDVLARMQQAGSQASIVFLDACRENPDLWLFEKGLSAMSVPSGVAMIYNTAPGTVVPATNENLSVFARHIQGVLQQGELSIQPMLETIKERIETETEGRQVPWFSYNAEGN